MKKSRLVEQTQSPNGGMDVTAFPATDTPLAFAAVVRFSFFHFDLGYLFVSITAT